MRTQTPTAGDADAALRPARDDLFRAVVEGVELRQDDGEDGEGRTLFGHFARFDEWTEIDSFFEGRFLERIAPGAFKKTFRERTPKVLFNHGFDELGRMALGSIEELREDDEGAYYEVRLFEGLPDLLMDGLRAGEYGASFRFKVMREDVVKSPKASAHNPAALPERTIREVQVSEFGPVTFPAYEGATAGVRSLTDNIIFSRLARDENALRQLIEFRDRASALTGRSADEDPAAEPDGSDDAGDAPDNEREQDPAAAHATGDSAPSKDSAGAEPHPDRERRAHRPLRGALGRPPVGYLPERRSLR